MGSYLRPASLDDALAALEAGPRTLLAGGTDIYPARVDRAIDDDILDVSGLPDLRAISLANGVCRIPAQATWTDLVRHDLPPRFDGLKAAAGAIGGVQIQNRGTICGNVCNASPAADGLPNLIALDARVELTSAAGRREIPCGDFVVGNRRTVRRPDELVTALLVPVPEGRARSSFHKLGARAYLVISIAMVAAVAEFGADGRITTARIVVGACSEVPVRLPGVEGRLLGRLPSDELARTVQPADLAPLAPIDDVRAPAAYRRDAALVLVRRAIADLAT
jgi:CO/xanthine dehydrogenase FAD-binding subunit